MDFVGEVEIDIGAWDYNDPVRIIEKSLFYAKKWQITGDDSDKSKSIDCVHECMKLIESSNNLSLCISSGLVGIYFILTSISEIFSEISPEPLGSAIDGVIDDSIRELVESMKLEFVSGLSGILYYCICRRREQAAFFIMREFSRRIDLSNDGLTVVGLDTVDSDSLNLGFAHGVPGVVSAMTLAMKVFPRLQDDYFLMVERIVGYCRDQVSSSGEFPWLLKDNLPARIGWCYGNLSLILMYAVQYQCFGDESRKEDALNLIALCNNRIYSGDHSFVDAGICHGPAGVIVLYRYFQKVFDYEDEKICQFLADEVEKYKFANHKVRPYYPFTTIEHFAPSILQSATGVALVRMSKDLLNEGWLAIIGIPIENVNDFGV
ncbi:MAG: hypothetical protein OIF51_02885 [Cellvibrionaceae bacterium]|nr:hypothetical protein [Cellvibrionaceae bacterium]